MTNFEFKIPVFILLLTLCPGCWSQITQAQDNSRRTCVPLTENINVQLSCTSVDKTKTVVVDCATSSAIGIGTIAKYKCKPFYVPFDQSGPPQNQDGNELKCNNNGKWSGLVRYESFRCKEDCGKVYKTKPLIINGKATNSSQWPWHASIFRSSGNGQSWGYICGGTLIRNQIILTASHCLVIDNDRFSNADNFRVILGAVSSVFDENMKLTGPTVYTVRQVYISQNYDSKKDYQADIAVMHLKEYVQYSQHTLPVCLPNDYITDVHAIKPGARGIVAGFGLTEEAKRSRNLRSVTLTVKTNSECFDSLQTVQSTSQLCAGGVKGEPWVAVCNGDSGGGLCFASTVHERFYIHGVTSFGSKTCQTTAVFTRVYPFTFWVRDVIEEISGEIARDLHTSAPYPYSLAGTETQPVSFDGLPREWENRITSLGVEYALVDESKIRDSLAYAKPLRLFNLSHVTLQGAVSGFQGRVLLPHISTFYLDILKPDFRLGNDVRFPVAEPEREKYMQNLLFFDKNYDLLSNWDFSELTNLETNIDLRVHIFKLIHVHRERGELHLHQAPFADKVLQGTVAAEFVLRSLALRNCGRINIDNIPPTVEWLTVDHTQLNKYGLGRFTKLQLLSLSPSEMLRIDTSDLPSNSLRHLYLSKNVHLQHQKQSDSASDVNIRISFPGQTALARFQSLETFCCDSCLLDTNLVSNFATCFPRVKLIVLKSVDNSTATAFLQLQSLQKFVHFPHADRSGVGSIHVRTSARQWESRSISHAEFQHQSFACSAASAFWTSEVEFLARSRLTSFEKSAYSSGHYSFTGNSVQAFTGIPASIQPALTSIHLQALSLTPAILLDSIAGCGHRLGSVRLANVTVAEVQRNVVFRLKSVQLDGDGGTVEYVEEIVDGKSAIMIPFLQPGARHANILHKLLSNVNSLQCNDIATTFFHDVFFRQIRPTMDYYDRVLSGVPPNHPLRSTGCTIEFHRTFTVPVNALFPQDFELPGLNIVNSTVTRGFAENVLLRRVLGQKFVSWQITRALEVLTPFLTAFYGTRRKAAAQLPNTQAIALNLAQNKLSRLLA